MTEIGLGLQGDKRPGEYAELATLAEAHGFDVLSVYGDLMFQPPIVPLLEMARVTGRARLGAACWNPYSLHPYEIAGQVAALDMVSGGRAYLGLAQGAWLGSVGIRRRRPVRALADAVEVINALLRGDDGGFAGQEFRIDPGTRLRYPVLRPKVPVLIGTWGPRTAALAGRVADELKIGGTANPDMIGIIRDRIAAGTAEAGRAPTDVGVVAGAVTVVDEDAELARATARSEVAMYLGVVAALDPTVRLPPGLVSELTALVHAGEHEKAGALVPDDVLDRFAFSGAPADVARQAQRLIDAGACRVEFGTPHGLGAPHGVELLGSRVLPLLRR